MDTLARFHSQKLGQAQKALGINVDSLYSLRSEILKVELMPKSGGSSNTCIRSNILNYLKGFNLFSLSLIIMKSPSLKFLGFFYVSQPYVYILHYLIKSSC